MEPSRITDTDFLYCLSGLDHIFKGGQSLFVQWSWSFLFHFAWNSKECRWFKTGNLGWAFQHNAQRHFKTGGGWNDTKPKPKWSGIPEEPNFLPLFWRHLSLHAKKNMKPVQRLKGDLFTVFDCQRFIGMRDPGSPQRAPDAAKEIATGYEKIFFTLSMVAHKSSCAVLPQRFSGLKPGWTRPWCVGFIFGA